MFKIIHLTCLFILYASFFLSGDVCEKEGISAAEKRQLRDEAKEMFYHAYNSYMNHAYPADELMPLSCKGRYRGTEPSRGDIDETLGNFSLTAIDTLDTLAILGDITEFEKAVNRVIHDVKFDHDIVVSVFETNIRVLGGLLSGHIMASFIHDRLSRMDWYTGQLLNMAKEIGFRLLPAFNTTTGLPTPKINLKHGLNSPMLGHMRETCTACAGTMILEFAALSRLSGESIFEDKARKAMDYLWELRHRSSDLMGTVLNIYSGDWVRRESGVGAGIDSYYEYCLKAYILLGDETYLDRFNTHYSAVMKYVSQGPLLLDVHMHRPHTNSRNFMDALLAFWPGLQVLKGDIKPAIETHEMLYQVMKKHNFLPEAFTTDFQVHWGQHLLRPEFLESTYFLHKATGDPYYLEAGKNVLNSLQKLARVPCGFAAVKDVRTGTHEDRMDSFVLAETFKYLYLLFADKEDLLFDLDDFIFTTEAHLFPLTLARLSNSTIIPLTGRTFHNYLDANGEEEDFERSCPTTNYLFPGNRNYAHSLRKPLKNMVEETCPKSRSIRRRLKVEEFQATNKEHLKLLSKMGISVLMIEGGKVQLVQTYNQAETPDDAEEGLLFMQDMLEFSKHQVTTGGDPQLRAVVIKSSDSSLITFLNGGPAQFGANVPKDQEVTGQVMVANPSKACSSITNESEISGKIAIMQRGDCMFIEKARNIQKAGAIAGIVIDNHPGTSSETSPFFAMSGDGSTDIVIPLVFLFTLEADVLITKLKSDPKMLVSIADVSGTSDGKKDGVAKDVVSANTGTSSPENDERKIDDKLATGSLTNSDVIMNILNKLNTEIKSIKETFGINLSSDKKDAKVSPSSSADEAKTGDTSNRNKGEPRAKSKVSNPNNDDLIPVGSSYIKRVSLSKMNDDAETISDSGRRSRDDVCASESDRCKSASKVNVQNYDDENVAENLNEEKMPSYVEEDFQSSDKIVIGESDILDETKWTHPSVVLSVIYGLVVTLLTSRITFGAVN